MPMKSKAQNRLMHAAAADPKVAASAGVPQKVAAKLVKESAGQKARKLPERAKRPR